MMKDISTIPVRHNAAKIAFVHIEMNILLCGHCTLFSIRTCRNEHPPLWSLYLVYNQNCTSSLMFVTVTELITVHFGETNKHTTCVFYFFYSES